MRTKEELDLLYKQTKALIKQGTGITAACNETGLGVGAYYTREKAKPSQRKHRKITVTNLPEVKADQGKLFMVYGSPTMLADFAKGLA